MRNNILKQVANRIENLLEFALKMDSLNKELYFLTSYNSYYYWRCSQWVFFKFFDKFRFLRIEAINVSKLRQNVSSSCLC
jgi:hypothetical protein